MHTQAVTQRTREVAPDIAHDGATATYKCKPVSQASPSHRQARLTGKPVSQASPSHTRASLTAVLFSSCAADSSLACDVTLAPASAQSAGAATLMSSYVQHTGRSGTCRSCGSAWQTTRTAAGRPSRSARWSMRRLAACGWRKPTTSPSRSPRRTSHRVPGARCSPPPSACGAAVLEGFGRRRSKGACARASFLARPPAMPRRASTTRFESKSPWVDPRAGSTRKAHAACASV
jgi:hypothetical protein